MKGLYVHIPFCSKICTYCDFTKRIPKNRKMIWDYLKQIKKEYNQIKEKNYTTIYIGGGTPSMLNIKELTFLFDIFKDQKPVEYTIEVNPESYTAEKGNLFKKYNINRVSLGIQTFNENILKQLNRGHINEDVFFAVEHLNSIGINNISADLIFSLPNQTIDDLKKDLSILKTLNIKHISYYSLILESKTVLHHQYLNGVYIPNTNEKEASMFELVIKKLEDYGFIQYEISNFTKNKKYESLHNKLYWKTKHYDAVGAGSHGFVDNIRYYHTTNITNYIKYPVKCIEEQTEHQTYQDTLIFGLRLLEGISLTDIKEKFNKNPLNDFPRLNYFIEKDLLILKDNILKVTNKGLFLLNQIVEVFI